MKCPCSKLLVLCFSIGLASCSAFYTRHYTNGRFYDGFAHRRQPATHAEKPPLPAVAQYAPDSLTHISYKPLPEEKTKLHPNKQPASTSGRLLFSIHPACTKSNAVLFSPVPAKALKPMNRQIRTAQQANSVIGKAALYILALVLAVVIVALAVYFLPAILLPAPVVTTFTTIVLIGAIVLLCVFAFLIYTLIGLLIELFRQKKTTEEAGEDPF